MSIFLHRSFTGITTICIMLSLSACSYEGYSSNDSYFKRDGYNYHPAYVNSQPSSTFRSANSVRTVSNPNSLNVLAGNSTRIANNTVSKAEDNQGNPGKDIFLWVPDFARNDPARIPDAINGRFYNIGSGYTGKHLDRDIKTGVVKSPINGNDLAKRLGIKPTDDAVQQRALNVLSPVLPPASDLIGINNSVLQGGLSEALFGNNTSSNDRDANRISDKPTIAEVDTSITVETDNSTADNSSADNSAADNSSADNSTADNSSADNSAADNSSADNSTAAEPADKASDSKAKTE